MKASRVVKVLQMVLVVVGLPCAWTEMEASDCRDIHVDLPGPIFQCNESPVGFCSAGTVASGLLKGSKEAVYQGLVPSAGMPGVEPASTLSYSGTSVFHTDNGDVQTSFVGVLDTVRLVFTEVSRIMAGSGGFAGVSGDLFISGTITADGTSFESRITGQICYKNDGDDDGE